MNEAEKNAIETIRYLKCLKWYEHAFDNGTEVLEEEEKQDIDIVLNFIKKQNNKIQKALDFINDENNFFEDGENWQNVLKIKEILEEEN